MTKRTVRRTFGRAFFDRYYTKQTTAVVTPEEIRRLAAFVLAYLAHLRVPVRTALDAGCGVGSWKRALHSLDRSIRYTGIDTSDYTCEEYGWLHSSIADFRSRSKFDLIICQDVLQYVDDGEVRRSVGNIARLCRGALYLDVATKEDIDDGTLDLRKTDQDIHVRSVQWYRRLVDRYFIGAGGGLFIPKKSSTVLLALEKG